jgi:polar amino acid transport system substrate-binding protein
MYGKRNIVVCSACLVVVLLLCVPGFAQTTATKPLTVGTKDAAPFSMQNSDGSWDGISIELWREIAEELQLPYEFEERDLDGLLAGLEDGSLDVAVAAITITADREARVDFSHPIYSTGLTIAASSSGKGSWARAAERFLSYRFFEIVGLLAAILLGVGLLVWLFERKRNPEQFGGSAAHGIGSGFWWSAVTMTTVGYGDKAPRTFVGRIIGLLWMFTAIIIVSGFTAAITTALTVSHFESLVRGPKDLPNVRVGTVAGSTSENYLSTRHLSYATYPSPLDGLNAVADGHVDAMVYDAPILRYLISKHFKGRVQALPDRFERQDYGIGLPSKSPLRERINQIILRKITEPEWQRILNQYLGE